MKPVKVQSVGGIFEIFPNECLQAPPNAQISNVEHEYGKMPKHKLRGSFTGSGIMAESAFVEGGRLSGWSRAVGSLISVLFILFSHGIGKNLWEITCWGSEIKEFNGK